MTTTPQQIVTAEQLLQTPGLGRCELVRGELIMMTPAGFDHGSIVVNVTAPLAVFGLFRFQVQNPRNTAFRPAAICRRSAILCPTASDARFRSKISRLKSVPTDFTP